MVRFDRVVGSGPFAAASTVRGSAYKMVRNDRYYEPGLPHLDGLWFLVMPEPAVRLAALKTHEVDMIPIITEAEAEDLEAGHAGQVRVLKEPSADGNTVQMNLDRPPFGDPRVRRAVNLAIDRDEARIALRGGFDGAVMPAGGRWTLGLDRPYVRQYGDWLWALLRLDAGRSLASGIPVVEEMAPRCAVTLELAALTTLLVVGFALPAGLLAASRRGGWTDRAVRAPARPVVPGPASLLDRAASWRSRPG